MTIDRRALDRAVDAEILTAEQADAVVALGAEPAPSGNRRERVAEVLGYLGAAVAVVAAVILADDLWVEVPAAAVASAAVVAVCCLAGGAVLRGRSGAAGRLGGFLWGGAVAAVAGMTAAVVFTVLDMPFDVGWLIVFAAALLTAVPLWVLRPAAIGQTAVFVTLLGTLLSALDLSELSDDYWGPTLLLVGLVWMAAAHADRIRPAAAGLVLGSLAVAVGPLTTWTGREIWVGVAVMCVAVLVAVGVRTRQPGVLAVGVVGMAVALPTAVTTWFDGIGFGPLLVLLVAAGLVLVGVAVLALRRRQPEPPGRERRSRVRA